MLVGGDDIGIQRHVVLGQTVGGGLRRGGFQVIQVAVFFLIVAQAFAHVVKHIAGEALRGLVGQILMQPLGVQAGFVHAHQADGGEVIVKRAQIPAGIGVKTLVHQLGDDGALDLQ